MRGEEEGLVEEEGPGILLKPIGPLRGRGIAGAGAGASTVWNKMSPFRGRGVAGAGGGRQVEPNDAVTAERSLLGCHV